MKKLTIGVLGIFVVLIIIYFGSWLFGINISKLNISICASGSKPYKGFYNLAINSGCYVPSIYEGNVCYKKSDCGKGFCVTEAKDAKKGVCQDHPNCTSVLLDNNGNKEAFGFCPGI